MGGNGSGKTTLFHIIMGLLKPLSGKIEAFGTQREAEADFIEVRRRIGLLFQDADDQLRLVKRICRELDLDEARWPPRHWSARTSARP